MAFDIKTVGMLSVLLGLNLVTRTALAADAAQAQPQEPPVAKVEEGTGNGEADAEAPSLEFLEFLGNWETDDGEWIAPQDLADDSFVELIDAAAATGIDTEIETGPDSNDLN